MISIKSDRAALFSMLSEWIGKELSEQTVFIIPESPDTIEPMRINRPEFGLFESQHNLLEAQYGISNINRTPKIWAFAQGGIGQPNPMNFFEVDPQGYYILGIQLNWDIYDWGNTSRNMGSCGTSSHTIRWSMTYWLARKGKTSATTRMSNRCSSVSCCNWRIWSKLCRV